MVKLSKRRSHKAHKGRSASKQSHKARKAHKARKIHKRSQGGMAPVSQLDMGWSAKMSLGQGADYLKYHVGQHGGALQGADLSSLGNDALPNQLRASAHISGLDKAFEDIRGLSDHSGGRRKSRKASKGRSASKKARKASKKAKSRKSRKSHKRSKSRKGRPASHKRRRGGALGFAPFPAAGMLLSSSEHDRTGLNPHWRDVEVDAARARAGL